jgi:hypothetical protein
VTTEPIDLDLPEDDDEDLRGVYWTPPVEAEMDELHPRLLNEIADRERRHIRIYVADAFHVPSCAPMGHFEVAIDIAAGRVCGVYREARVESYDAVAKVCHGVDEATTPAWLSSSADPDDAVMVIYGSLKLSGELE